MKLRNLQLNKILIFAISFLAIGIGIVSIHNRLTYREPYDGITLIQAENGLIELTVAANSPAYRAGLESGDKLYAIKTRISLPDNRTVLRSWNFSSSKQITTTIYNNNNEIEASLFEELYQPTDCQKILWYQGTAGDVNYTVLKGNQLKEAHFKISGEPLPNNKLYLFMSFVGFCSLLIGLSVTFSSKGLREHNLHFYLLCLAFFLLFALSYTSNNDFLGRTILWLEIAARLFLPALFLHFFLVFPAAKKLFLNQPKLAGFVYVPAVVLMILIFALMNYNVMFMPSEGQLGLKLNYGFLALNKGVLIYFSVFFLLGIAALIGSYRSSKNIWIKKQAKWMLWGLGLGLGPLAVLYIPFYLLEKMTTSVTIFSTLPLIIIPLAMAYAILKYKLMDVEVIIKRGMVFALAIGSVMALYMLLVSSISNYFPGMNPELLAALTFLATLLVVILFAPIKNKIQTYLDKILYKDRYDVRIELKGISSELSREVNLGQLLETLVNRVADTLNVENVAIALYSDGESRKFTIAKSVGNTIKLIRNLSEDFSAFIPSALSSKDYLTVEEPFKLSSEFPADKNLLTAFSQIHFIPFMAKEELKALLIVGIKEDNLPLSSEDLQLLTTIAGPAAIALENALLYKALHHKAEELAELKDYLENIVESINAGVLVIDLEEKIISWNSKLERLYGLKREDAIGKKLSTVFPTDFLNSASAFLGQNGWITREINSIYKIPLRNKRGVKIIVNFSIAPLFKKDGEIYGKVIIFDDITERITLEEQLQHSEKLAALGYLSASVAHEVNTPLTGISSYIQMLLKKMDENDPRIELLRKVEKHSFRASQIVNNLLNFSRKKESKFQEIDVNKVIQETLSLIDYQLKRCKINVALQLDTKLPQTYGDQGRLQQLFMNMFLNARDSMQCGGTLAIATLAENSDIIINIKDTGIGIPEENLNKIYKPFFTTKPAGGTGLGLSVSYGIVQQHMGSISVKSTPGKGTLFKIKLPIYKGSYEEEKTHISN
jgi:two-component system NtrC family sensor kinase